MPDSTDWKSIALAVTATSLFWVSLFSVLLLVWVSPSDYEANPPATAAIVQPPPEQQQPEQWKEVTPAGDPGSTSSSAAPDDTSIAWAPAASTSSSSPAAFDATTAVLVPPSAPPAQPSVAEGDDMLAELVEQLDDSRATMNQYCMSMRPRKGCTEWPRLPEAGERPCLADVLADLVISSSRLLTKHGVVHWMSYGTLLGIYRDHAIIPWTTDADVAVLETNKSELLRKIKLDFYKAGYWVYNMKPTVAHSPLRVCVGAHSQRWKHAAFKQDEQTPSEHWPRIDFFPVTNASDTELEIYEGCVYKTSTIFPLSTLELFGNTLPTPANVPLHLKQTYGPNYMLPPKSKSGGLGHCRPEFLAFEA